MKNVINERNTIFVVDEEARSVKAILRGTKYDAIKTIFNTTEGTVDLGDCFLLNNSYSATATCSEKDTFDVEKGKEIAKKKAILKYNKAKLKRLQEINSFMLEISDRIKNVTEYTEKKCNRFEEALKSY